MKHFSSSNLLNKITDINNQIIPADAQQYQNKVELEKKKLNIEINPVKYYNNIYDLNLLF